MEIQATTAEVTGLAVDALVVGVGVGPAWTAAATAIDQATGGLLTRLLERGEISTKLGDVFPLWGATGVQSPLVLVVGLGSLAELSAGEMFRAAGAAALNLAAKPRHTVAFYLDDGQNAAVTTAGVAGAIVGCQGQDLYRAQRRRTPFQQILWAGGSAGGIHEGKILGESLNLTRRLVNEPPQEMYPASFARQAEQTAQECGLEVEIWDAERLVKERCGSLLAVAKGSDRPPRLVMLRHRGAAGNAPLLALVGKGVTFDSGGLSLKPSDSMKTMKCDMAGAATVLGAMQAIARLKLPVNVIGLMGLVENMTGGNAMKLGDVLHARNGRTIEVLNTDAEGRLVLADVLDVAVEQGASRIIDLATLTGACVVALGTDVTGLMTNDQHWCDAISTAARDCGERVWQLPMFPEYSELIRSEVADIRNIGDGRWGGAITAAKFLEEFVAGRPWTHLDIAGPAYAEKSKPWLDGGGTAVMLRTLVEVARKWE